MDLGPRLAAVLSDRYTIERELGRGGMATVFLARDLKHHRPVAIKVLRPEIANALGGERFLQEIEIAAQLTHPHILPLFDSGEADGLLYYVMPYVEGESLRDRLKREKQLPVEDALQITRHVAAALTHAHSLGIVHRDIKPGNIMLESGEAVVADFGIARAVSTAGGDRLTETGMSIGTPEYMSPEQAGGEKTIDGRSDLYSLGCVLHEMLAGDPPFTGATSQAILARQMQEAPPALSIVRSTVTPSVEYAVQRVLAKVPADRPMTAERFVELLEAPVPTTGESQARSRVRKRTLATATLVVVIALGFGLWQTMFGGGVALDDNRVMVFPMVETGIGDLSEGIGETVALGIGSALEETAPLRWVDGWFSLDDEQRANLDGVTNQERNAIARAAGARYRLDGSIVTTGDSTSIILWLYDVKADSLVQRKTVAGASTGASVMRLAIVGVKQLLPALLQPGRDIERIPLEDRDLAAVTLWMEGKREYRASRFRAALALYERAVERDSALAMAALNAAQAASWLAQFGKAEQLINIALMYVSYLPEPMTHLARGLHGYLTGNADSAVAWLRLALESDVEWAEAHMALGEVFYHLLPSGEYPLDSLAEAEFRAASADSNFSPPLFHLAESAIRRGDVDEASALTDRYRDFDPEPRTIVQLAFMLDCLREGPRNVDWATAVRVAPLQALNAARALSAGGRQALCGENGFRAVLLDSSATHLHWGATLGLQGVLLAGGRYDDFMVLVDSAINHRPPTMTLYLLGTIADTQLTPKALEAEAFIKRAFGQEYQSSPSTQLTWTMGAWHTHRGDAEIVHTLRDALAERVNDRQATLFAGSLSGHLAFLDGDSAGAVAVLGALSSTARIDSVEWQPGESLPSGRLLLANLLYESGRYMEAIHVASTFDHPGPIIFPAYVAASLALRYRAALALPNRRLVSEYRGRLLDLGRSDLIGGI